MRGKMKEKTKKILVTGHCGLIGSSIFPELKSEGFLLKGIDICSPVETFKGDVRDSERIAAEIQDCDGIIHLAAVSRVIFGEQNPELCRSTNIGGLRNIINATLSSRKKPWLIFASSREVYGHPESLPADESSSFMPVNVYGHTKVDGEKLITDAIENNGLRASIVRFSNVFGKTYDHYDRVVPAFARAAVLGETLRVDGMEHTFDFTYIDDVVKGISSLVQIMEETKELLPPIHFVSGIPTTLGELAEMAVEIASSNSEIRTAPPRSYDVARFYGCPKRAEKYLNWTAETPLEKGLSNLINAFQIELRLKSQEVQR
jgi:UDP-glucose 4-epimerase